MAVGGVGGGGEVHGGLKQTPGMPEVAELEGRGSAAGSSLWPWLAAASTAEGAAAIVASMETGDTAGCGRG